MKYSLHKIPQNLPYIQGTEIKNILSVLATRQLSGNGAYTKLCEEHIEQDLSIRKTLLTHSGTAALEMMAILAKIKPGDEIIMPSFTFSSTANAFVLRGAVPVFVDIRPDTLNLDENLIEEAITEKTRAVVPVHYAGVACEMDSICKIAHKHKLFVLEDAAQGYLSTYKDKYLGSIGDMSAFSFHETKNIISGEGGAININNPAFDTRSEIVWEKGTNRTQFYRGKVDKYTWVDVGSSYLPAEIIAAFLESQLRSAKQITSKRTTLWNAYHKSFMPYAASGLLQLPFVPDYCCHNAHIYYMILPSPQARDRLIKHLGSLGILSVFHYIPLHSAPAGKQFGRIGSTMDVTDRIHCRLVRLPLYTDMSKSDLSMVIKSIHAFFRNV